MVETEGVADPFKLLLKNPKKVRSGFPVPGGKGARRLPFRSGASGQKNTRSGGRNGCFMNSLTNDKRQKL